MNGNGDREAGKGRTDNGAPSAGAGTAAAARADTAAGPRVLVALTGSARDVALDMSLELFDEARVELLGVLVEDRSVLAHAHSTLAREVVLSGLERRLDPTRLDRQLRARAGAVRKAFERGAARLGLVHSFEIVHGNPLDELRRAARGADALLIDASARAACRLGDWPQRTLQELAGTPLRRIVFAGETGRNQADVVVIAEADRRNRATAAALAAAFGAARRMQSPLRVMLLRNDVGTDRGEAETRADIERAARAAGLRVEEVVVLPASRARAVAASFARRARLTVLTPRQAADPALIADLILRTRGAVLVVGES